MAWPHALSGRLRSIAVAGLVFVGLLIVTFAAGAAPEAEKSDMTILDYYEDSGNQAKQIVAALIAKIGLTAFLVFVTGLRLVLVESGARAPLPDLAFVGVSPAR